MEEKPEHAAKWRMMELMQLGRPWQEAATMAGVHTVDQRHPAGSSSTAPEEKPPCKMGGTGTSPRCASPSKRGLKPDVAGSQACQVPLFRKS